MNDPRIVPLAYSYLRMSTKEQLQGDSSRRQKEASQAYALKHGLHLVEERELEDIGLSAFTGKNLAKGSLGKFIEKIESGDIPEGSYFLVESVDRLSRQNITEAFPLFLKILKAGIKIVTLTDERVFDNRSTDFEVIMSIFPMMLAHEESEKKSFRLKGSWAQKRKNASKEKMTERCPSWLRLRADKNTFEIDTSKADIIRDVFQMSAEGYGGYALLNHLNENEIPTLTGAKLWAGSSIQKLLTSRAVLGEFQPHTKPGSTNKRTPEGPPHKDYYPRILDDELFDKVQIARAQRKVMGAGRRGKNMANVFSRLARCHYCGAPMQLQDKGKPPKGGKYLRCSGSIRGSGCTASSWSYPKFEKSFFYFLRHEIDLNSLINAVAVARRRKTAKQHVADLMNEIASLEQKRSGRASLIDQIASTAKGNAHSTIEFVAGELVVITKAIEDKRSELENANMMYDNSQQSESEGSAVETAKLLSDLENADEAARSRVRSEVGNLVKDLRIAPNGLTPEKAYLGKGTMAYELLTGQTNGGVFLFPAQKTFEVRFVDDTTKTVGVGDRNPLSFVFFADGFTDETLDPNGPVMRRGRFGRLDENGVREELTDEYLSQTEEAKQLRRSWDLED